MVKNGIFLGKRYEVISKIGAGGMADVYKGKDTMLNRYVAIKVLKKEYREDENFVRKFRSEAQAAAGLMHPNIVNVYDVGEDRGLYYMVMELVEGITLKEYIAKKGRLSHRETISIAIQMCSGIGAAHAAGIIHRDIKPQNIIISNDGKVKVTDFGIAKAVTSNTISSNAMGSVHYTSPEQARGGYSDAKSDIYSVGITLFEMVTGHVPFDGDSAVAVAVKHLQEEITPPSEFVPDIPYSLEQIILKCTQKNGERRYGSTAELLQDLKRSLVDPDGDFVNIPPLRNADTVIITDEELDDIRHTYDDEYDDDGDEDYDDDDYGDDDYGDDEDDDYGDDDYDYGRKRDSGNRRRRSGSEEVNPRMNKVMKILMIIVAVIIAFIMIFAIGRAAGLFRGFGPGIVADKDEETVKVPDLLGMTEEQVKAKLDEADYKGKLGYKVVERKESDKYEEGLVCEQKQKAGSKVKLHSTIQIVISSGLVGKEIPVPDVAGKSEQEAQKILEDAGFKKVTSEAKYDASVPAGTVIGTTPAAGANATAETEIKMTVSMGIEKVDVPKVTGMSENDAKNAITGAGLSVGEVSTDYSDSVSEGKVISQSPASGKVDAGTSVSIVVSLGKKPDERVDIQNFIGRYEEELLSWASQNQMNASKQGQEYSSNYAEGVIISQSPTSGKAAKGSTIGYTISLGPRPADPSEENNPSDGGE